MLHRSRACGPGLAPNGSRSGPAHTSLWLCRAMRILSWCQRHASTLSQQLQKAPSIHSTYRFFRLSVLTPGRQGSYVIVGTRHYFLKTVFTLLICIVALASFSPRHSELAPWVKTNHSLSSYDGLWPPHPEILMAPILCSAISPQGSPPRSHNLPKKPLQPYPTGFSKPFKEQFIFSTRLTSWVMKWMSSPPTVYVSSSFCLY